MYIQGTSCQNWLAHGRRDSQSSPCWVLCLAEDQIAKQNAILFTKSARLYTKFKVSSLTAPQ